MQTFPMNAAARIPLTSLTTNQTAFFEAPAISHDIVITDDCADSKIRELLEAEGHDYNPDISTTANLLIASEGAEFANHVPLVTLEGVTFHYDLWDKQAVESALGVDNDKLLLFFQSTIKLDRCVFRSEAGLRVRLAANSDVIILEGDTYCDAASSLQDNDTVHLNGEKTTADVNRYATAHVNKPGALANGYSGANIYINVAGGIARFLHPRAKVYERVDGGIIEAEMYRPTGEAYFADYYQSYAETKFCSYADHLINQGRIDELFELAQAKITSPLSTADDINKGIFYLTRAALAECAYEPAIEMATDLIEQAISMIKDPTTSTAELKKNLMWLRIAANAGYAPAEVFLADMVSLKLQEIFCYYETTEKKEASLSFINVACEIDYHAAVELHHSTLSKEALLETAKEHLGKWDYWSEPAYFSDTLDGLFFLLDERDSAGNQDFITHKLYRRVYWSDAWFNKAKTKIENHLNDISMIQGANYLAMACWAGHEPAIAYRNKQASIWLDKAKMKIESPISNSDDRDVGRFYFELARRTHYAPAMGYLRSYADNPTMWRRLTGFNCA